MKNRRNKVLGLIGACALVIGSLTACGSEPAASSEAQTSSAAQTSSVAQTSSETQTGSTAQESGAADTELTGSLQMVGSTSMEKLANALIEVYAEKCPGVNVSVEFSGSGAGVEAVIGKTADIGNVSRELKAEEKEQGVVENVVAIDGIAVCVDKTNTVTDLSKEQLINIYNGTVTNWSEVGGEDMPITVVGREAGSGTRGAFEELLELKDACKYANELDSTGAVMAKVASTPGAIGYVSLDALDDSVTALAFEGVEPTVENIKSGAYTLSRPFVMATNGEISEQNEVVQAWFDFVLGADGQEVAQTVGLITVE